MFVLDEADDIISRGFNDKIHDLFTKLPHNIQTIVSTSTYRSDLQEVTAALMKDPIKMLNQENSVTLEGILQFYIAVEREVKRTVFVSFLRVVMHSLSLLRN